MRARQAAGRRRPLEVQAVYSMAELARASNVSSHLLRSLLRARDVELIQAGRLFYVPLAEIEAKLPVLWRSIQAAEMLRAGFE
jgi:hypothetical protein